MLSNAATVALEGLLNGYLQLDDDVLQRLGKLHGKVICIDITDFNLRLWFLPAPERLQLQGRYEGQADCTLRGTTLDLARMGLRQGPGELFGGGIEIGGDSALAQRFGQILGAIDIDWEEHLSRLIGDIPAHQLGYRLRQLADWGKHSRRSLEMDVGEYLQEERLLAPRPEEVAAFTREVDELRDDVERLEARVRRLQGRLQPGPA